MSKKSNSEKTFTLDEYDEATLKQFLGGQLNGMYQGYEVFDTVFRKLRDSIDNVWMIYDEADSLDQSSEEQKQKLAFARHTLFVLGQMFQDEYDMQLDKVKAQMRED